MNYSKSIVIVYLVFSYKWLSKGKFISPDVDMWKHHRDLLRNRPLLWPRRQPPAGKTAQRPSRPTASPEDSGRTGPAASGRSAPPPERSRRNDRPDRIKDAGWKIIGFSSLHSIVGGSTTSGTEVPAPRKFEPIADRTACGRSIP